MASVEDVASIALALPRAAPGERHGNRTWTVGGKVFAWERGFSKADIRRFGDAGPPDGPIVALVTADLSDKEAVLAAGSPGVFSIPHFDRYAAVLVQLEVVAERTLEELIVDAWLACAPPDVAEAYEAERRRS